MERITAPVNQIACCNRGCNIAWRRIFCPYLRREIRHVIRRIERRNHAHAIMMRFRNHEQPSPIISEVFSLWQMHDTLGGGGAPAFTGEDLLEESSEVDEDPWSNGADSSPSWHDRDLDPTSSP